MLFPRFPKFCFIAVSPILLTIAFQYPRLLLSPMEVVIHLFFCYLLPVVVISKVYLGGKYHPSTSTPPPPSKKIAIIGLQFTPFYIPVGVAQTCHKNEQTYRGQSYVYIFIFWSTSQPNIIMSLNSVLSTPLVFSAPTSITILLLYRLLNLGSPGCWIQIVTFQGYPVQKMVHL